MPTTPFVVKDWELGIADSAHEGIGRIKNADIESFPGALKVAKLPSTMFHSITTRTFTAVAATDVCTASGAIEANAANFKGAAVKFTTTGTLPAGISLNKVYFLIFVSATTFKIAEPGGSFNDGFKNSGAGSQAELALNITDTGTGTHTMTQVPIGTIKWILKDPRSGYHFALDSNGRVWFDNNANRFYLLHNSLLDTGSGVLTNASGNGLILTPFSSTTSTWLFAFRNNLLDYINIFSDTEIEAGAWSNGWKTMNTTGGVSNSHEAVVGQDAIIYFCDARYVGTLKENDDLTFDPITASTYTYQNQALDLPPREIAQCLAGQGTNILIGGETFDKIYPWDRVSDSFNNPLVCPEFSIKKIKNVGGNVYIFPGTWGNIYFTQGTYVKFFKKVPFYVFNDAYTVQSNPLTWGDVAQLNGSLLFGISGLTSGSSGLYRLYLDGRLVHENTPSTGSANVTAIFAESAFYRMGYSGGCDYFAGTLYATNYDTVVHSPLVPVGEKVGKGTYSRLEIKIANGTASGKIRVKYRTDTIASFADFPGATIDQTLDGSSKSYTYDIGLIDLENLQLQAEMHGTIELLSITLYP